MFGLSSGVGRSVATLFAERGFSRIILTFRDADCLAQDALAVRSARLEATVVESLVDFDNVWHVQESLRKVNQGLGEALLRCRRCVLFTGTRTGNSDSANDST